MATLESEFLTFSIEKIEQLTERIETCVAKLTPEQVWLRGSEQQNAVGNLLLHLNGNVRQWILSGIGGGRDAVWCRVPPRWARWPSRRSSAPMSCCAQSRACLNGRRH